MHSQVIDIRFFLNLIRLHIIAIILLSILSGCTGILNNQVYHLEEEIMTLDNWQYYEGSNKPDSADWRNIKSPTDLPEINNANSIWLRTEMPDRVCNSPALYVGQVDYFMQVTLNGETVYRLGDSSSYYFKNILGLNQNLVELPGIKKGDIVEILIRVEKKSENNFGNILFGSSGTIIKSVFSHSFNNLFFSVFSFIMGLIVLVISVSLYKSRLLVGIGVLLISLAVFMVSNSLFMQIMFKLPALFYHLDYSSFMVNTASGFYIIEQIVLEKYKKIIRTIWVTHIAILVICLLLINLTTITYLDIVPWFLGILSVNMIIGFVVIIISTGRGNYRSNLLYIGMTCFIVFALLEIIHFLISQPVNEFGYQVRYLHFGVVSFVISIIWIEIKRNKEALREKEIANQKELESVKRESEIRQHYTLRLIKSQENERNRIALGLHDSVGQKLLLIKNQLLTIQRKINEQSTSDSIERVNNLAGETIQEIRDISWNLRPQHLDQLGLTTAVETLVERVKESSDIIYNLEIDNIDNIIPEENEIDLYRIIQECLNNIVKHSKGTVASIMIKRNETGFILEIKDNGIGSKQMGDKREGLGLTGMYERAEILGAKLNVDFSESSGTSITLNYLT